jgi:hypothetical protein
MGVMADISERIAFVRVIGPTSATWQRTKTGAVIVTTASYDTANRLYPLQRSDIGRLALVAVALPVVCAIQHQ